MFRLRLSGRRSTESSSSTSNPPYPTKLRILVSKTLSSLEPAGITLFTTILYSSNMPDFSFSSIKSLIRDTPFVPAPVEQRGAVPTVYVQFELLTQPNFPPGPLGTAYIAPVEDVGPYKPGPWQHGQPAPRNRRHHWRKHLIQQHPTL
ncbi:MAG: hypothetical protein J3R72DRAFT_486604 [Linnemannia gamsii]|nr:MAG: hypothetical protein J3R72DRAFT_486604 [Linnemannia gamsii]